MNKVATKRSFDDEREYLENLLNTRFNFFVVFLSIIGVAFVSEKVLANDSLRLCLSLAAAIVSGLIAILVGRTRALVDKVLFEIRRDNMHPYTIACDKVDEDTSVFFLHKIKATVIISVIPWLATVAFSALALMMSIRLIGN